MCKHWVSQSKTSQAFCFVVGSLNADINRVSPSQEDISAYVYTNIDSVDDIPVVLCGVASSLRE